MPIARKPRPKRLSPYQHMIACLAARHCFDAGQSVGQIAKSAKRSPATIRRWLLVTAHLRRPHARKTPQA